MNQPELGKRIAELRKAKGFTQEELVEKCNINVRTLQRIESGEVTPRSYTVKTIFTALDFTVYDSTNNKSESSEFFRSVFSNFSCIVILACALEFELNGNNITTHRVIVGIDRIINFFIVFVFKLNKSKRYR